MKILKTINELKTYRNSFTCKLGFIPTMGALHQGHISLIKQAVNDNEKTIVSVFVNPTQFLEGEDYKSYPNRYAADIKICELAGVDALFMPDKDDMYFEDEPTIIAPPKQSYILEGFCRPKHFDGVLRVVLKLFNLVKPTNAYFGKKDTQQLFLIKNMVKTLYLDINIVPCEIIREENGLALSSRNAYLSEEEKVQALSISQSLRIASNEIMRGERNTNIIKDKMHTILTALSVDYIEILDRDFDKVDTIELKNSMILVAARVGKTRLIDNMWI